MNRYKLASQLQKEAGILSLGADIAAKVLPKIESIGSKAVSGVKSLGKVAPVANGVDNIKAFNSRAATALKARGYNMNPRHLLLGTGLAAGGAYGTYRAGKAMFGSN